MIAPALSLAELRARYGALGKLEDLDGERSFIIRCITFDSLLKFGQTVAQDFATTRRGYPWQVDRLVEMHPALFVLVEATWPGAVRLR
ncbi:MAG: hypothetical protein D4R84_18285 [Rhodocyclaceae bacterium]|nr:MAG: hypothetical protein D4R84_18285 [Rhodocyclaceae bacterium]